MVNFLTGYELSIRRSVNIYTGIVFSGFGFLLIWLATERYHEFINTHTQIAIKSTEIAAYEVENIIQTKRLTLGIFMEDYNTLIAELSRNPEDEDLHQLLNEKLGKYFPDFFASNIMTSVGEPLIEDFAGQIGDLCLTDLRHYLDTNKPNIRVHPNYEAYHYDISRKILIDDEPQIFFASFNLSDISDLLKSVQEPGHQLILIYRDGDNDLIEILSEGGRNSIEGRVNFRLNDDEKTRILSYIDIEGTRWHAVDMYSPGLFSTYLESIIKDCLIIYFVFSIAAIYMRTILVAQDERRALAENSLRQSHQEIEGLNKQLASLSRQDSLTGIFNRRYFDDRIEDEWSRCIRSSSILTCILIDIDYFKQFNDRYGHQAGDDCLKAVAKLLSKVFKRATDVVARYGGEEFIVIMTDVSPDEALKAAKQFQDALEKLSIPHHASKIADHVTVSIGIASHVPLRDEGVETFILKADMALYSAKDEGRNKVVMNER